MKGSDSVKKTASKTEDMIDSLSLLIGAVVVVVVGIILKYFGAFLRGKEGKIDSDTLIPEIKKLLEDIMKRLSNEHLYNIEDKVVEIRDIMERKRDQKGKEASEDSKQILEDYHVIAEFIGILNAIQDLGGFVAPYENFIEDVEEEIKVLERREIQGSEYFRRSHQLKFALNMALVYARVKGNWDMIPEIKSYLERTKPL